jgi:hypothetical protein
VLAKGLFSLVSDPLSFSADDARREYEAEATGPNKPRKIGLQ